MDEPCDLSKDRALSIPLSIVFYKADDFLRIDNLNVFRCWWWWLIGRLTEIITRCEYCHVQAYYETLTHCTPHHGKSVSVYCVSPEWRPYTVQYMLYDVKYRSFCFHTRHVSAWKNLKWWLCTNFKGYRPNNCISDVEYCMRMQLTLEPNNVCKRKRKFKTIAEIEESILRGDWGRYGKRLSDHIEPRFYQLDSQQG